MFNENVFKIKYAIREYIPYAEELERKGKKIFYLNIGDPLKYDFQTPKHIIEALYNATKNGYNYYSSSQGDLELRKAIAYKEKKYNNVDISEDDIVVTNGVSEAINFLTTLLINPGEKVLLPDPVYPLYPAYVNLNRGIPIFYKCDENNGWMPNIDDIRNKIDSKVKLLILINPNNPTGSLYSEKILKEIIDIAGEYNLFLASDEIYDRIVYEGEFKSLASLTKDVLIFGLNGFSKTYLMTGWRLGYIYVKDPENNYRDKIIDGFIRLARCRLCVNTPVQKAGVAAIYGSQKHLENMILKLRKRKEYLVKRLKEIGFYTTNPNAAFYVFPKINIDDNKFTFKLLLEENVLVVHGSGFGENGRNHLRIVFLPPQEIMEEALNRIERFYRKYYAR